jgi:hypothetical protein
MEKVYRGLERRKPKRPEEKVYLVYFVYTTGWFTVDNVVGATATQTLNIMSDADFQAVYMTVAVRQANILVVNWAGDIQIDDSARGRTLFNTPLAVDAIAGGGGLPYPFNPPRLFRGSSSVLVTITNNVATETDVHVAFHGNKMYQADVEAMV